MQITGITIHTVDRPKDKDTKTFSTHTVFAEMLLQCYLANVESAVSWLYQM